MARALRVRDDWREVVFSVPQARRALKYVASIAREAASAFNTVRHCRNLLEQGVSRETRTTLAEQRDVAIQCLDAAIDECNVVGAHLIDLESASVSFRTTIDGREACLIWRGDWPVEHAWADLAGE